MGNEPIIMENEGSQRTERCPRWNWENGSISYGPVFSDPATVQAFLDAPPVGVQHGEMVERTITITPWEPVLPAGVLRLDELAGCEEYGGIRVAELGDGVVEGYTAVAFTDDVDKALRAVRAHMVMVHNESPMLALFREDEPVRYWQVYGTCGCGDTCPIGAITLWATECQRPLNLPDPEVDEPIEAPADMPLCKRCDDAVKDEVSR